VLSDVGFWETDLTALPGFTEAVTNYLKKLIDEGAAKLITRFQSNSMIA
jgi:hypothetical protein